MLRLNSIKYIRQLEVLKLSYFFLYGGYMQYIKNLFLSFGEIILVMLIQYSLLLGCILIFGMNKSIILGTFILSLFELIYIFIKLKSTKFSFKHNYFPYILLGLSLSIIYNMTIFKLGFKFDVTSIPLIIEILASGIIGPIFEEVLFRYSLINKLSRFNNNTLCIMLSSFIFAICHTGIITIIYAFIIGLFNSYFYIKKKDILVPITIHISANVVSSFLFNFNPYILTLGIIMFIISLISSKN